jgi:hypothetical protein
MDTITDKRGGVCFRVDDNQTIQKWTAFAEVFNRHGLKFCAALNYGRMVGNEEYIKLARTLEAQGHEVMDHTPIHSVDKFPLPEGDDPEAWRARPGVDHVDEQRVYLTYEKIAPAGLAGGRGDISGKRMTGRTPGDLSETNRNRFTAVYLPDLDKVYMFEQKGEGEDAFLELRSFWNEDNVDLGERRDAVYYKLSKSDVDITLEGRRRLTEASLRLAEGLGLRRPVTWIQPGSGGCSDFHREEVRECYGDLYGYVSAATYPNRALKCYNEYDPDGDKRFGMMWGDFDDEGKDLAWNQKRIADGVARHFVLFGHSHFWERVMPDGWEGYLRRVDGLLSWCRETGIPARTQAEWARILYDTRQDPGVDVFPGLGVDRDGDGVPDGYEILQARLDRGDGAPGVGVSLAVEKAGPVCRVARLGGLEKGVNAFTIWTRGRGEVAVTFTFPEVGKAGTLAFRGEGPAWTSHRGTVSVPHEASLADIAIDCTGCGGGDFKVSGMGLRQAS